MKIIHNGDTLNISEIEQLGNAESESFLSRMVAELRSGIKQIEIDLSSTRFLDCGGVGALVALRASARRDYNGVKFQVLNPSSQARQLFNLTRLEYFLNPQTD